MIKRHFYNGVDYEVDSENQVVEIKPIFWEKLQNKKLWGQFGFKKIGGSSIGDVLELDSFSSQFTAFCRMTWIGMPILDKKYINAGVAIEPIVIDTLENVLATKIRTFDPKKVSYDIFKDSKIVGGIPDGLVEDQELLLEIKTTGFKNFANWSKYGPPIKYLKQAGLYTYLLNYHDYAIVAAFLDERDYSEPKKFPIKKRHLKSWRYKLNPNDVEDDIAKVESWYKEAISNPISPKFDFSKNKDEIDFLLCEKEGDWLQLQERWKLEGKIPFE